MGLLVDGKWIDKWYDTKASGGKFIRQDAGFRNWITSDGSAGVSGKSGFKAESGRYHLYVSLACPWAHRTLIFRELKGLQDHISVDVVHPDMMNEGWTFEQRGAAKGDSLFQSKFAHEIYTRANPTANTTFHNPTPIIATTNKESKNEGKPNITSIILDPITSTLPPI